MPPLEGRAATGRSRARKLIAALLVVACSTPPPTEPSPVPCKSCQPSEAAGAATPAPASTPLAASDAPAVAALVTPPARPARVDLRDVLIAWKLPPRPQGARGTCSIFTTCESIEFALARARGEATRFSPEFLNWAASQHAGRASDGNFFHHALGGFARLGLCKEESLPYREVFDPALAPAESTLAEAAALRDECNGSLVVHWIVPWQAGKTGVSDAELDAIRDVLARGDPVAAGSGHSRLLVGYVDDDSKAGGGTFVTEDSALAAFSEVPYEFVRKQVNDVFWIEAVARSSRVTAQ
jgi:hypothetical protein